ncbi:MAG: hypothetical protein Q4C64_03600 [Erysipelotrichia bacterium]|nr:hypothetical protein [Erysipelotrichia bacterium]
MVKIIKLSDSDREMIISVKEYLNVHKETIKKLWLKEYCTIDDLLQWIDKTLEKNEYDSDVQSKDFLYFADVKDFYGAFLGEYCQFIKEHISDITFE